MAADISKRYDDIKRSINLAYRVLIAAASDETNDKINEKCWKSWSIFFFTRPVRPEGDRQKQGKIIVGTVIDGMCPLT